MSADHREDSGLSREFMAKWEGAAESHRRRLAEEAEPESRALEELAQRTLGDLMGERATAKATSGGRWWLAAAAVLVAAALWFLREPAPESNRTGVRLGTGSELKLSHPLGVVAEYNEFRWSWSGAAGAVDQFELRIWQADAPESMEPAVTEWLRDAFWVPKESVQQRLPDDLRWEVIVHGVVSEDPLASQRGAATRDR